MTRILLGSGGFRTPERRELLRSTIMHHVGESVSAVLFVPHALADHDAYVARVREERVFGDLDVVGLHEYSDPVQAVAGADAIFVGGGNTFRLVREMHRMALLDPIRRAVAGGTPYIGVSAGSNLACPTMMTTNDMPICELPSFEALGLVPFQINAHYFFGPTFIEVDGESVQHFGETRDDRLREYHELNATPVVGLWEPGFIRVIDGEVSLEAAPARVFLPGRDPVDVAPPASLTEWLSTPSHP